MWTKRVRNLAVRSLLALIAAVVGYGLPYSVEWLAHLELGINQERLIRLRPTQPNPKLLIIRITKETPTRLEELSPKLLEKAGSLDETLPRYLHAFLLQQLERAHPRLFVCDMYFERSRRKDDWPLLDYFDREQGMPVVLLWTLEEVEESLRYRPGYRYRFKDPAVIRRPLPERITLASYAAFNPGGGVDGAVLRQWDPDGRLALYLAAEAALRLEGLQADDLKLDAGGGLLRAGPYTWPVGHDEEFHIRWTDRNSHFDSVEYSEALQLLSTPEGRERFRDRIILLGDATGRDLERTTRGDIDGVECVAEMLNTLLLPDRLTRLSEELNLLWCFLLALWVTLALSSLRPVAVVGGSLAASAAVIFLPQATLRWGNVWVDTVAAALAVVAALLLAGGWEGLRSGDLARRFTPRHIREGRIRRQTEIATVMFVDVKGSTPLVARLGAEGAREVLGGFLRTLGELLHRHGGDVERTMGDGMLVVFRAHGKEPPDAHTLRCARSLPALWEAVRQLGATDADGNSVPLAVTVGFESGEISGERLHAIGHEEWALYGPTIHLAARLQSECGSRGAEAVFGPAAAAVLGKTETVMLLGSAALKGFEGMTPLYTLLEWRDEKSARIEESPETQTTESQEQ
jgi:class 3 adenylate cyclase